MYWLEAVNESPQGQAVRTTWTLGGAVVTWTHDLDSVNFSFPDDVEDEEREDIKRQGRWEGFDDWIPA